MSGAVSFVLGLLGLGASGAVNAKNGIEQMKKQAELDQIYTAQKPLTGQTRKSARCMIAFEKNGITFQIVIQIVLVNGHTIILTVWVPTIRLSFGSAII